MCLGLGGKTRVSSGDCNRCGCLLVFVRLVRSKKLYCYRIVNGMYNNSNKSNWFFIRPIYSIKKCSKTRLKFGEKSARLHL